MPAIFKQLEDNIVILRLALLAFEHNGYADFRREDLSRCNMNYTTLTNGLRELCNRGEIEDKTVNGYFQRFKLNYTGDCPAYIMSDKLHYSDKLFLSKLSKVLPVDVDYLSGKLATHLLLGYDTKMSSGPISSRLSNIKKVYGASVVDILRHDHIIRFNLLETIPNSEQDENGIKIILPSWNTKHHCQYCGEEDPSRFHGSHITCMKCHYSLNRARIRTDLAKFLYAKSRAGYTSRKNIKEYTLTEAIIQEQWDKQNHLDYYTGREVEDWTVLSLDRLDSSRGYVPDNIVITHKDINRMKMDYSVDKFKQLVSEIYLHSISSK